MMRILSIALAASLAACSTQNYDVPYGQDPYGYPGPPPAPGYPAPPPAYPAPPYPGATPPPEAAACPMTSSSNWRAAMAPPAAAGAEPRLVVSGTVVTPTGGYRAEFVPYLEFRGPEAEARLVLFPPQGPATQALETHDVRWEWPVRQPVAMVTVRCGGRVLAQVAPMPALQ